MKNNGYYMGGMGGGGGNKMHAERKTEKEDGGQRDENLAKCWVCCLWLQ